MLCSSKSISVGQLEHALPFNFSPTQFQGEVELLTSAIGYD